MSKSSRWSFYLSHPQRIPEALDRYFRKHQARHQMRTVTPSDIDRQRLELFDDEEYLQSLIDEAIQLPVFQQIKTVSDTDDPMEQIAASQTSSHEDALTIYLLVRTQKPEVMIETGVFYGAFSAMILHAMEANGSGRLYSIDLPLKRDGLDPEWRGRLVPDHLRHRWELILGDSKVELPKLLKQLRSIDGFNHDSNHTTEHMSWEYENAWPHIKPGGFLSSHDTLYTASWDRFTRRNSNEINKHGRIRGFGIAYKHSQSENEL